MFNPRRLGRHGFLLHLPVLGEGITPTIKVWLISFPGFCGLSLSTKEEKSAQSPVLDEKEFTSLIQRNAAIIANPLYISIGH